MIFEIKENAMLLRQKDGTTIKVDFKWPIAQVLEIKNVLVVRVEPKPGVNENQNVYGIGTDGSVLWQIGSHQFVYDDSPFTGLSQIDSHVKLSNWDGTNLVVDPTNGEILQEFRGK